MQLARGFVSRTIRFKFECTRHHRLPITRSHGPSWECRQDALRPSSAATQESTQSVEDGIPTVRRERGESGFVSAAATFGSFGNSWGRYIHQFHRCWLRFRRRATPASPNHSPSRSEILRSDGPPSARGLSRSRVRRGRVSASIPSSRQVDPPHPSVREHGRARRVRSDHPHDHLSPLISAGQHLELALDRPRCVKTSQRRGTRACSYASGSGTSPRPQA